MIRAESLRRFFGPIRAVDGVSFEIASGETFGLLGPNGAGKSTTIHMLIGALRPDSGTVTINDEADPTRPSVRRGLGFAPQALSLYDELTAEENLVFFARIHGLGGKALRARVDWALDFAELRDRRRDRTGGYSGGMRRRLNLVCALVHAPKVLLLDEPMAGVDPQSRNHLFERIEELQRAGMTILHTTHQMEEAHRLCRRVAIMDHGKILDAGTVEELIARHGDLSVVEATLERPPDDPARLPGTLDGTALRIETKRPLEEVAQLAAAGVRITSLNIHRPDLESVFLTLTGRKLRE